MGESLITEWHIIRSVQQIRQVCLDLPCLTHMDTHIWLLPLAAFWTMQRFNIMGVQWLGLLTNVSHSHTPSFHGIKVNKYKILTYTPQKKCIARPGVNPTSIGQEFCKESDLTSILRIFSDQNMSNSIFSIANSMLLFWTGDGAARYRSALCGTASWSIVTKVSNYLQIQSTKTCWDTLLM